MKKKKFLQGKEEKDRLEGALCVVIDKILGCPYDKKTFPCKSCMHMTTNLIKDGKWWYDE